MKSLIKMFGQILRQLGYIILYLLCVLVYPVQKNKVLFLSDSRDEMSGNFFFIYEEIKEKYEVKSILGIKNRKKCPKLDFCKELASAKYILVDDFYPVIYPIPLRRQTKLIQVWHAVGAFKTVGFARKQNKDHFSMTHRNYTAAIVSSPQIRKDYAKAFRMKECQIYSTGIPRTDIFFDEVYKEKTRIKLYEKYPELQGKRVILFAPTFRGNNLKQAYYDFEKIDFEKFQKAFSEDYICIIKMHPFIKNTYGQALNKGFYLDLSKEREINDLLLITDVLITDYSSVIFEASLLNIKTIFFAYDLEEYEKTRDFFYPYSKYTFGPVVKTQFELENAIMNQETDFEKILEFQSYFMKSCDGNSTKRFVETFLESDEI